MATLSKSVYAQEVGLENIFSAYRKTISEIRPTNCPHFPSCSSYSELVFKNLGPVKGIFLTTDRLMRCGHELGLYETVEIDGEIKFLDFHLIEFLDTIRNIRTEDQFIYRDYKKDNLDKLAFFNYLVDQKKYEDAILEYERIKFYDTKIEDLLFEYNYVRSLFALGKYEEIIQTINKSIFKDDTLFKIKLSESYYKLGDMDNAIMSLSGIENNKKYELLALIYSNKNDLTFAESSLNLIGRDYIFYDYVENNKAVISNLKSIKFKSKSLAGVLSVIPGGGYFYSGQKSTAITSFFLNTAFAYATFTSVKSNNYGVAGLTAIFGSAFYIGNILGGIKSAERYNLSRKKYYLNKMKYSYNN